VSDASRAVVNHVGLGVTDLERAQRFYTEVLGFEVDRVLQLPDAGSGPFLGVDPPVNLTAVYLVRDAFVLELLHFDRPGNQPAADRTFTQPGLTHLSFSVDDLPAALDQVVALGGEVVTSMGGQAAMVRDPDGQLLELMPMAYHEHLVAGRG